MATNAIVKNESDRGDESAVTVKVESEEDEVVKSNRENRLTSIIDQLRCQGKLKGKVKH